MLRPSHLLVASTLLLVITAPRASAQITEFREYHGKTIAREISGLRGFEIPCGLDGGDSYIFIGSVLSVAETKADERRLTLMPAEVFLGAPPNELTVVTNQGDCLPEIRTGDRWLFYLQQNYKPGKLALAYRSGSGPVVDSEKTIDLLRRLTQMKESGIIRGAVSRSWHHDEGESEWSERFESQDCSHAKIGWRRIPGLNR